MSDPRRCDPEAVFELADGTLGAQRGREIRAHLEDCPVCRELYERELELNALLRTSELAEPRSRVRLRVAAVLLLKKQETSAGRPTALR